MKKGSSKDILDRWTVDKSVDLYGINNWGGSYFSISPQGEVVVTPKQNGKTISVSIHEIVSGIQERGMNMPVLLRFENLLDAQLSNLHDSFNHAIKEFGYKGAYKGVFPVKVNQQQRVVDKITQFGSRYHHGLEVGSKAELIIALSMLKDKEACLICNGYKDKEFIDLGLYAIKMGFQCFFVVEMPGELDLILKQAVQRNVKPNLGVRVKLSTRGGGHWQESAGDRSIFGLNTAQIVRLVDRLKECDMLDCLKLLHFHIGSQIPNIRDIRSAVIEASRIYLELCIEGAEMGYLDLGGGLAVDYDGSKTNYVNSMNYTLSEYCADVIEVIMATLDEKKIPHPTIITESGRATVAYYCVLVFNVLDVSYFDPKTLPEAPPTDTHTLIKNLFEVNSVMSLKNLQECYNDTIYYMDEIRQHFKVGVLSLRDRALAETIFWNNILSIVKQKSKLRNQPPELEGIESSLADIYYCNFSIFQSLPDSWAIDQLFPIMPIHRLQEEPQRNAIIADITCDCDGKIDKFIDNRDVRQTLPLHDLDYQQEYYLGAFLVGAYQETLGDLHNLMGDPNVVSIRINEDSSYDLVREIDGDSVEDLLTYVEYDPKVLLENFRRRAEESVKSGHIKAPERRTIMKAFESTLKGYTYYES